MSDLFNVRKQLVFYGAYHNNPTNVRIHMIFVPLILWSWEAIQTSFFSHPAFLPEVHYKFNDYMIFDLNYATLYALANWLYYFSLEPLAALLYLPQYTLMLLTAIAFGYRPDALTIGFGLQAVSWVMQFAGHGFAEKRAPALLDNLLGAVVLAPFFVHLEVLFILGYKPQLHKDIQNGVGVEIAKMKKAAGDQKRAAAAAAKTD